MGLDVYLYTADQVARNDRYEEASAALYEEGPDGKTRRDLMTEAEYEAWKAEYSYTHYDDVPSERHPGHLFNRRYLRSSYNGSGFNRAVPEMLGHSGDSTDSVERGSIYWIFEAMGREWDGDEGNLTAEDIVRLRASKIRALEVAEGLRKADRLRVVTISANMFGPQPTHTDDEALSIYREHIAGRPSNDMGGSYSTLGGNLNVFGDGLSIIASVTGLDTFKIPAVHLIFRADDESVESYVQSAEIIAEFCDEAIGLIERDGSCQISWSG